MAGHEDEKIPSWAVKERESDLKWLSENVHVFLPAAQKGFAESGRGAIVADTTTLVTHESGQSHPFGYIVLAEFEKQNWQDVIRLVRGYAPEWEFVCVMLKGGRESAYRVGLPPEQRQQVTSIKP